MLPKIIPGHQWHLGAAEVGKARPKAPPNSSAVQALGSGCWQKPHQGVREYLKPRLTHNLIIFTTEKKITKSRSKCETLPGSFSPAAISVLPRLLLPVIRTCIQTPAPLEWHRDPVQGMTLRCGVLPQHHQCISPLHAHLSKELRGCQDRSVFRQTQLPRTLGLMQRTAKAPGWCVQQACFKMQVLATQCPIAPLCPWCEGNSSVC